MLALTLLLVATPVALEVGPMRSVPPETQTRIVGQLQQQLQALGYSVIDTSNGGGADDRLVIEVVGGVTMLRLVAERRTAVGGESPRITRVERDLPKENWAEPLAALVGELFERRPQPERPERPERTPKAEPPVPRETPSDPIVVSPPPSAAPKATWPLWISGAGVAVFGVGVGFGISSYSATQRVESEALYNGEGGALLESASNDAQIANALMLGGAILAAGGLVLFGVL